MDKKRLLIGVVCGSIAGAIVISVVGTWSAKINDPTYTPSELATGFLLLVGVAVPVVAVALAILAALGYLLLRRLGRLNLTTVLGTGAVCGGLLALIGYQVIGGNAPWASAIAGTAGGSAAAGACWRVAMHSTADATRTE